MTCQFHLFFPNLPIWGGINKLIWQLDFSPVLELLLRLLNVNAETWALAQEIGGRAERLLGMPYCTER